MTFGAVSTFVSNSLSSQGTVLGLGGAVFLDGGSLEFLSTVSFFSNSALGLGPVSGQGGAVFSAGGSIVFHSSVAFVNNSVPDGGAGGALTVYAGTVAFLSPVTFEGNAASTTSSVSGLGGAVVVGGGQLTFWSNVSFSCSCVTGGGSGGALAVTDGSVVFQSHSWFTGSLAPDGGVGGAVFMSAGLLSFAAPVFFSGNSATSTTQGIAHGGALYVAYNASLVFLTGSATRGCDMIALFANNSAVGGRGGAIALRGGLVTFEPMGLCPSTTLTALLDSNSASYGGAVYVENGALIFSGALLSNNWAAGTAGGAVAVLDGFLQCSTCQLVSNGHQKSNGINSLQGSGMYVGGGQILLADVLFSTNVNTGGNGTLFVSGGNISVANCTFSSNVALNGGALAWVSPAASVLLVSTLFLNNSAVMSGGAILSGTVSVNGTDLKYVGNRAARFGGVFAFDQAIGCIDVNCDSCDIVENVAGVAGGIAYFFDSNPFCQIAGDNDTTWAGNSAGNYGPAFASPPARLEFIMPSSSQPADNILNVTATLLDLFGQAVTTAGFIATFETTTEAVIVPFLNGVASTKVSLFGAPDLSVAVDAAVIGLPGLEGSRNVTLRGCSPGFGFDNGYLQCVACQGGSTYSFVSETTGPCEPCPPSEFVKCHVSEVVWRSGYWVFPNQQSGEAEVYACDPTHCLDDGRCAAYRTGVLCGTCLSGYSEWNDKCVRCAESDGGLLFGCLVMLWLFVLVEHVLAQRTSGFTKILFNFVQALVIVMFPDTLFAGAQLLSLVMISPNGDQCPFSRDGIGVYLTAVATPVLMLSMLALTFWGTRLVLRWKPLGPQSRWRRMLSPDAFARTFVILCIGSYQSLLQYSMSFFNCEMVAGQAVVVGEPSIRCDKGKYAEVAFIFGAVLVIVVLAPGLLFWSLWQHRHHVNKKVLGTRGGSATLALPAVIAALVQNYRPEFYCWEVVIALRKLCLMSAFVVFSSASSLNFRRVAVAYVMIVFAALQVVVQPFRMRFQNLCETVALTTVLFVAMAVGSDDQVVRNLLMIRIVAGTVTASLALIVLGRTLLAIDRLISRLSIARRSKNMDPTSLAATTDLYDPFQSIGASSALETPLIDDPEESTSPTATS